ncbi:short chain dehydrogenase reductase family protein, putative, partial [Ichthyophthirius multifiliis]
MLTVYIILLKNINHQYEKLDILINNGGQFNLDFKISPIGYESNFSVNHLGHFLLTNLLLEKLKNTKESRIIVVSSKVHDYIKNIDYNGLNVFDKKNMKFYCQSKFANLLFVNELARKLDGGNCKVVGLHPGVIRNNMLTYFYNNNGFLIKSIYYLGYPFIWLGTKSNFYGAQTTLTCCYTDFDKLQNGGYYQDNKI